MPSPETSLGPDVAAARALLDRPLLELVFEAASVHRAHHDPRRVQRAQLLSIKTGGCPEDCGYCSQSAHHQSELTRERLLALDEVITEAQRAKAGGAERFCMGAAWRDVKDGPEFDRVLEMVRAVKNLEMETCTTLGMLTSDQAQRLREAGLDYYNHNLDTGRSHYGDVVSTRTYDERLETLGAARDAGIALCCGGILGLGESTDQRAELLAELAAMDPPPESVPINNLVPVAGTPLQNQEPATWDELVRVIAAARILMPASVLRLSAGRDALSFLAGAGSIFVGDELLTTPNPDIEHDADLLTKLGLSS
jgi:biotin synthase